MKRGKFFGIMAATALFCAGTAMTSFAGWSQRDGRWNYYDDSSNQLVRDDWRQVNGKWYYMDYDGIMQANKLIDDTFYVDGSGAMVTDRWVEIRDGWEDSAWYYFGSNGKAYTNGWKQIGDSSYHFSDSRMDTGWQEINGSVYYLGTSGAMATGWRMLPDSQDEWGESWYYFSSRGKMAADGEQKINSETYIFDKDGRMLHGWVNPSDYTSTSLDNLSTGNVNSLKYYRSGGERASGWLYLSTPDTAEEAWYYLKDGRAYSRDYKATAAGNRYGLAKIKGETYCFDKEGKMVTGLVEIEDGRKFYFDEDGRMKTGRVVVNDDEHDNEVFYFTTTGRLGDKGDAYTGVRDGYLYEDGQLIRAEEGMRYEKVSVDGKNYVVNERGQIKTSGTVTDADGVKYKIEKGGDGGYKIEVIQ